MQVTDQKGNDQTPLASAFCWKYCKDKMLRQAMRRSSQTFPQKVWKRRSNEVRAARSVAQDARPPKI
jgi:hypothetical protein